MSEDLVGKTDREMKAEEMRKLADERRLVYWQEQNDKINAAIYKLIEEAANKGKTELMDLPEIYIPTPEVLERLRADGFKVEFIQLGAFSRKCHIYW